MRIVLFEPPARRSALNVLEAVVMKLPLAKDAVEPMTTLLFWKVSKRCITVVPSPS